VVGPYDFKLSEMGRFFVDFVKGRLKVYIEGSCDFVDVRDVAIGHVLACEKGRTGESYILSGEVITVHALMLLLEGITGVRAPRSKLPVGLAQLAAIFTPLYHRLTRTKPLFTKYSIQTLVRGCNVSREKARRELGYSPRPLRESIVDAIQWFKENGKL